MSKVDKIIDDVEALLKKAQPEMTEVLKPLAKLKAEDEQLFSVVEVFHSNGYAVNCNSFFGRSSGALDVNYEELSGAEEILQPVNEYFENLRSRGHGLNQQEGMELFERHEQQLRDFFAVCWSKAGGKKAAVTLYLAFEKEYRCRGLLTDEVMEEREAAIKHGFTPS